MLRVQIRKRMLIFSEEQIGKFCADPRIGAAIRLTSAVRDIDRIRSTVP